MNRIHYHGEMYDVLLSFLESGKPFSINDILKQYPMWNYESIVTYITIFRQKGYLIFTETVPFIDRFGNTGYYARYHCGDDLTRWLTERGYKCYTEE